MPEIIITKEIYEELEHQGFENILARTEYILVREEPEDETCEPLATNIDCYRGGGQSGRCVKKKRRNPTDILTLNPMWRSKINKLSSTQAVVAEVAAKQFRDIDDMQSQDLTTLCHIELEDSTECKDAVSGLLGALLDAGVLLNLTHPLNYEDLDYGQPRSKQGVVESQDSSDESGELDILQRNLL